MQPGFVAAGLPFRQRHRHPGNHDWRSRELLRFNPSTSEARPPTEPQPYRILRVTPQFATCSMTGPADPAWSSRYLRPGDEVKGGDRQPYSPKGWRPERVRVHLGGAKAYRIANFSMGRLDLTIVRVSGPTRAGPHRTCPAEPSRPESLSPRSDDAASDREPDE